MDMVGIIILVLSLLDCICCLICRVPQIVRLVVLKESQAISIPFWICNMLSCVMCITAYALKIFALNEWTTIIFLISASMNLILNTLTLGLVIRYRRIN